MKTATAVAKITLRNNKKEIFDAYIELRDLTGNNDLAIVAKLLDKYKPSAGTRSHSIYLNLKNLHKAMVRNS